MRKNGMESREREAVMLLMAEMLVKRGLLGNAEKGRIAGIIAREVKTGKGECFGKSGNL